MSLKFRISSVLFPLFCAFSLLLFPGASVFAQSASVSGRVIDPSSAVVRKAQITFTDLTKGTSQTTRTNDDGFYSLPFVQPGTYMLTVESSGFKRFERKAITVTTAQSLVLDVRLQVGDVSQTVTVNSGGNGINTTDATVSTVVDREFVENIPLNGRSFQSLMTMVPGVSVVPTSSGLGVGASGEMTVNGQRTEENYFTVDGVSANTGAAAGSNEAVGYGGGTPGETVLGTTQSIVSIDDLQEFRATTSTYSAEYGRTPGGQFIFQTRSGTNALHGSAFDYFRNNALDANNYFNKYYTPITPRQVERQNDFGGTLGGPIRIPWLYNGRDRTFFFFSYEGLRLKIPTAATLTTVPSLSLREDAPVALQPFLNAFPLPNGVDQTGIDTGAAYYTAGYSSPSDLDSSSIRIDHHFGDKMLVFFRYSDTSSSSATRAVGGIGYSMAVITTHSGNVKTSTAGVTNTFTPHFNSDLRFNFTSNANASTQTTDNFGGATPISESYLDSIPGFSQGKTIMMRLEFGQDDPTVYFDPLTNYQHQINVVETMNYSLGRHNLKWGVDYRRLFTSDFLPHFWSQGIYTEESQVLSNQAYEVGSYLDSYQRKPVYTDFSAFLQDEWKVTPRLNLSLGLRWELNPAPKDADGHNPYAITTTNIATLALAPPNTPLWNTTYDNFAPRFAMAYQLHNEPGHETVIRAGGGIFYDLGSSPYASGGYTSDGFTTAGTLLGASFPMTQAQIDAIPAPSAEPPYTWQVYGVDPHLKLPYTWEWNAALEQSLGREQTLTLSYVGSAARRLLTTLYYNAATLEPLNPNFDASLFLVKNQATSDYNALQVQFQRKMSHGLQALASYTWSHSIDEGTTNFWSTQGLERASSDYDIRHNFQLGLRYEVPGRYESRIASSVLTHWAFDARITSRSALPVDITGGFTPDPTTGTLQYFQPSSVAGQPMYLYGSQYPGGRIINYNAFTIPKDANGNYIEGDVGRNSARAFGATQADLALNREFPLWRLSRLQFRAEAFNIFNHAIMGDIYNSLEYDGSGVNGFGYAYNTLNTALGGLNSLYQVGGQRSLQLSLKVHF